MCNTFEQHKIHLSINRMLLKIIETFLRTNVIFYDIAEDVVCWNVRFARIRNSSKISLGANRKKNRIHNKLQ